MGMPQLGVADHPVHAALTRVNVDRIVEMQRVITAGGALEKKSKRLEKEEAKESKRLEKEEAKARMIELIANARQVTASSKAAAEADKMGWILKAKEQGKRERKKGPASKESKNEDFLARVEAQRVRDKNKADRDSLARLEILAAQQEREKANEGRKSSTKNYS